MIAQAVNLMNFLKGPKQFIIPIYQRTYSWTLKECGQLWDDIVKTGGNDKVAGHFVGSVVYIERGLYQVSSIPQLLVIDGQQRLTTISLLLAAFGRALEGSSESLDITRKKIDNYFLLNPEEESDLRYKLMLTQTDKDTLIRLIEGKELTEQKSGRITENNRFFEEKIRISGVSLETLYKGISKLIIVDISLDRDHDNPQLIFESLNSTGLELSQADLIRNYILMGLEPREQTGLYNDYWYAMEKSFGQSAYKTHFDRFMRDYLIFKMNRIPKIDEVYQEFKQYVYGQQAATIQEIVADIYRFSRYFVFIALEKETDRELREAFCDINALKVDVVYPLLIELYDDYANQILLKEAFVEAVRLIESYVFRRAVCGIPPNSLNKTFATFTKNLDKANYMDNFKASFILMDSYRRFPADEEFRRELMVKDLYNFRTRNYWLRRLEDYDRKEKVNVENYTIEHVMPQNENLSEAWRQALGENWKQVQERYLHTLGNLTLTGYNAELSDRPFFEKRNMQGGFADSPIRLNRSLAAIENWNEDEIKRRAEIVSEQVLKVWSFPQVADDVLKRYKEEDKTRGKKYSLEDHPQLTGPMLELFNQLRRRITNIDSSVSEEILKLYIAYKSATNFVDVVPQKTRLRLSINMRFGEIDDPKGLCRDVTNLGRWGNGDVEVSLSSKDQLEDVMYLINQSFEKNTDNGNH